MNQIRQPNAPSCFQLFKPHLEQWGIIATEKEFLQFWFSGETINEEILNYTTDLKKQGFKIFFLSNNFKERTTYYRKNFPELFKTVDKYYFSWETGYIKPDTKAWLNILKEHSLEPQDCLYFDDSEKNVTIAKNIGIHTLVFTNLQTTKQAIEKLSPKQNSSSILPNYSPATRNKIL